MKYRKFELIFWTVLIISSFFVAVAVHATPSPAPLPRWCWVDSSGDPLVGGELDTWENGTTTDKATWTDQTQATPNTNPVILGSDGCADIWIEGEYTFRLRTTGGGTTLFTADNLLGINEESVWRVESGSPTTFPTAAGNSVSIGNGNDILGLTTDNAGIFMGTNITINSDADGSAVLGGSGSTVNASSKNVGIVGGSGNSTDSTFADRSFLGGGLGNACAQADCGIVGGNLNDSNASRSFIAAGSSNVINSTAADSMAMGSKSKIIHLNQFGLGGGDFSGLGATDGSIQFSIIPLRVVTTDATPTDLSAGAGGILLLDAGVGWNFRVTIIGIQQGGAGGSVGDAGAYTIEGLIKRALVAAPGDTAIVGSVTIVTLAEDDAAWDVTATASAGAPGFLKITVTGAATDTIHWVGTLQITQVGYGS